MPLRCALVLGIAAQVACTGAAAGVAFSPGTKPAGAPVAFSDTGHESPPGEREALSQATTKPAPTVGVSFVVNGRPFDAGSLPPPPIPVVVAP